LSPVPRPQALAQASRRASIGLVSLVVGLALLVHDLMGANKPHELHKAPLVHACLGLTLLMAVLAARRLPAAWRERGAVRGAGHLQWFPVLFLGLAVAGYASFFAFALVRSWT
jgi:ABC-type glycerol-3-phosphate transport system permease component